MLVAVSLAFVTVGCRARGEPPTTQANATSPPSPGRPVLDDEIPFTPVLGEAVPSEPCGPAARAPCLLLKVEDWHWAWGHTAWFMDTAGGEYEFSFTSRDHPGVDPKDGDRLLQAQWDGVVSAEDFARIVAASMALPRQVTAFEIRHALALVASSQAGTIETVSSPLSCTDGGGREIKSYLFAARWNGSVGRRLENYECGVLLERNEAPAARELSRWIDQILRARRAWRAPLQ